MSSQDFMTTRRKFMQRSALGAGGLLFSSMLLASCTDHDIPDPQNPTDPPLLTLDIAWNDDAKTMVTSAIEMIPVAGDILGGLVSIFWPDTKEDVWGEIKAQVEALVEQDIAAAVYTQVSEDLKGLNLSIIKYLNEIKEGTPAEILDKWIDLIGSFEVSLPHFQSAGNELPLLPLFGQFANMHLALLRDAVTFGEGWNRTDADHQQDITDLQTAISDYSAYTNITYINGLFNLMAKTKADPHLNEPFKSVNTFNRQIYLTVFDFRDIWPYFDVTLYPKGTSVLLTREIYSDPFGTCDNSGNIVIKTPAPTQQPTNLNVWGGDRIQSVQLTYPAGSGPGGVTTTPRMGDSNGGSNQSPQGGIFTISPNNPILAARATWGSIVNSLQFQFSDGTTTSMMGAGGTGGLGSNDTGLIGYPYEALSSIHINGVSDFYGSADCVVFGFMYWQSPAATLRAIGIMYVKSPKERSAADFIKEFPNVAIPAGLITEELKLARKLYWEYIKERAKG